MVPRSRDLACVSWLCPFVQWPRAGFKIRVELARERQSVKRSQIASHAREPESHRVSAVVPHLCRKISLLSAYAPSHNCRAEAL